MTGWSERRRAWMVSAGLTVGVFLLYANSLDNGFHYDDSHSLVDNHHVRSLANTGRFFADPGMFSAMPEARMYRPLVLVTYAVNHALGEYDPFGYHLVNVLLHAANVCLLWLLARRLLEGHATALAAALLFAVHPVVSEPVNYVSSRSTSLATLFILGAAILFVDALRHPRGRHHLALTALTAAALLTKSVGVVVVPLAALYLLLVHAGVRHWWLLSGPAAACVAYAAWTWTIIGKAFGEPVRMMASQIGTQVKAIPHYAQTCLMPTRLSIEPQFAEAPDLAGPAALLALALTLCMAAAVIGLRRRCPAAAYGAAWFGVCLAPSSMVPLNVLVNEHRLYLPLVGGVILASSLLGAAGQRRRWFVPALVAVWSVLVVQRNGDWQTQESVWADAAGKGPEMSRPHINLGKAYLEQGRHEEAIAASRRGLEIDPNTARAHYNIGTAYLRQGRFEESVASFERALEIEPQMMEALNNLGTLYQEQGQFRRAAEYFRRGLALTDHPRLHHNLGSAHLTSGQLDSAIVHFQRAVEASPLDRESHEGLGRALRAGERLQSAVQVLSRALQRWPEDAELLRLLAATHAALGRDGEALATFRRAGLSEAEARLQLGQVAEGRREWRRARSHYEAGLVKAPDDARLHEALGTVHYALDDPQTALAQFRHAAELEPSLATAYRHIGLVYLQSGRPTEAVAALERARDLEEGEESRTWEFLARAHALAGDDDRAVVEYRRAIELEPSRAGLYHNLAVLHEKVDAVTEAERLYGEAIERAPEEPQSYYNLGYLFLDQSRYAEATAVIERAVALDPAQAEAYVNLASAYLNLDQGTRAAAAYERFLQLYQTDDSTRRKVETQLRLLRESGE